MPTQCFIVPARSSSGPGHKPDDYRPNTGPFYASRNHEGTWAVLGEQPDGWHLIVANDLQKRDYAVSLVDRLHQVIDRWTEKMKGEK